MEKSSPKQKRFHIERGVHSGFPSCCIRYFLFRTTYWPTWLMDCSLYIRRLMFKKYAEVQYVRCPRCVLFNHVVKMHKCNWECCGQTGHDKSNCVKCKHTNKKRRRLSDVK